MGICFVRQDMTILLVTKLILWFREITPIDGSYRMQKHYTQRCTDSMIGFGRRRKRHMLETKLLLMKLAFLSCEIVAMIPL
jgi:hypothetical protein